METLGKTVRFAGMQEQGFRDGFGYLQTTVATRSPKKITREFTGSLQRTVKRIGAIQVFYPKPSHPGDLGTGEYRLTRAVRNFSYYQSPYHGRIRQFQVATAFKTKA